MITTLFFWVFALAATAMGFGVLISRNPMHSAICLIVTLVSVAGLFLLLAAEFLAWILVIVYTGAVMVLIVFVISLLNLQTDNPIPYNAARGWGIAAVFVFLMFFLVYMYNDPMITELSGELIRVPETYGAARTLALDLYTRYMLIVQLAGVLLTAAVIGAVVIARQEPDDPGADS